VLKNILFKYQENNKLDYLLKNEFIFLKSKICEISNNISITNNTISKLAEIDNLKRIMFKLNRLNLLKKALYINEFKFKSTYILPLVKLFEKIYGKKVTFNIISLKNYFLNSDIMNQILAYKMSKRKHRGKATKFLRSAMRNIKTPKLSHNTVIRESNKITGIQNILIKRNIVNTSLNKDKLSNIIEKNFVDNNENYSSFYNKNQQFNILNSIKNKSVSGVRLEVAGRITRRITAQRAAYKYRYVGTLKNFDSSYKGLSSVMLRGNLGSNVQYTNLKSKTLIGSFGLKG
jgi:ribosomal protein S3